MPMCWALVRRIFRVKRFDGASDDGTMGGTGGFERSGARRRSERYSITTSSNTGEAGWENRGRPGDAGAEIGFGEELRRTETEEFIIANMNGSGIGGRQKELELNRWSTGEEMASGSASKMRHGDEDLGPGKVRAW